MKKYIKSIINGILKHFGLKLIWAKPAQKKKTKPDLKMEYVHDPAYSYMKEKSHREKLNAELAIYAETFFSGKKLSTGEELSIRDHIADFFTLYTKRKFTDNTSGSGFHNAFWLFLLCRAMNPELIVESGVWKGHTTWLLEQACPTAKIYGFDVNLNHVEYKGLNAELIEADWNTFDFRDFNPEKSFVFFDCHVNHAQRILEAKSKGFKHLIFDDNPPLHKIYSHIPGIPTAHMLHAREGLDNQSISWMWNNQEQNKPINNDQARKAADLILNHEYFPDVGGPTRYGGFTFLAYVHIR